MTELLVPVTGDVLDIVLSRISFDAAVAGSVSSNYQKVSAPAAIAAAKEVWARIEKVLRRAAIDGWEAVREEVRLVGDFLDARTAELLSEAAQLRDALIEKLREAMQGIHDFVLGSIRTRVKIGEDTYVLGSIDLASKLVYSGSIEGSITALCKFVASGESVVTGKYTLLTPAPSA